MPPPDHMNEVVQEILRGSIDMHVHSGPEPGRERRMDALETGRHAYEAEMGGFVLKSHLYPTAPLADVLSRMYPGLRVFGAITMNEAVGGLNASAVEASAELGAKVVWMPTSSGASSARLFDDDGSLVPEVRDILDVVSSRDMVLASGHLLPAQAIALFHEAASTGVRAMVATHPVGRASPEELRKMVALGAYVELTFLSCTPSVGGTTPTEMADCIRGLGVANCIVTTDFGQWMNPPPAEGIRMAIAELLNAGLAPDEVSTLVKGNPAALLGAIPSSKSGRRLG